MINFSEIQPGDLLKVLVNIDDIDDETYAIAKENMKDYLVVNYYLDTVSYTHLTLPTILLV